MATCGRKFESINPWIEIGGQTTGTYRRSFGNPLGRNEETEEEMLDLLPARDCSQGITDHSTPPTAGVNNKWRYNSIPLNHLKPTGYVIHQQFNIQQLYIQPTLYLSVL